MTLLSYITALVGVFIQHALKVTNKIAQDKSAGSAMHHYLLKQYKTS